MFALQDNYATYHACLEEVHPTCKMQNGGFGVKQDANHLTTRIAETMNKVKNKPHPSWAKFNERLIAAIFQPHPKQSAPLNLMFPQNHDHLIFSLANHNHCCPDKCI